MLRAALACALLPALPLHAWTEPARGSADRAALMDALRPVAEQELGAPVEFVVRDLRLDGDVALMRLTAQRPGGGEIDLAETPMVQRGRAPDTIDGPGVDALMRYADGFWQVAHWAIGPTDVWYADPALCPDFAAVLTDTCP
ncbi:hypothetical protein RNZ50_09650 [Paracoccaceae bacterium Fryx2]|nr:hypothetical protein [Paracoccaceae bacterium Fryx2]